MLRSVLLFGIMVDQYRNPVSSELHNNISNCKIYCLEPFQNWLDDKMLPILEDVEPAHCIPAMPVKMDDIKTAVVPDTGILIKEFETVFDAVGTFVTPEQLTPPQSPPYEQPILTTLETIPTQPIYQIEDKQQQQAVYHVPERQIILPFPHTPLNISLEYPVVNTPQPDVAHELAVVDELVRSRVDDMVPWSGPSSPSSSSSSSNFGDCSSDDPEWIPESVEPPSDLNIVAKTSRKRSKPYSRTPTEEKKSRKKEQNKNAATRYRLKKKAEVEEILEEERNLMKQNEDLENKIGDVQREIKYLKGLMRDLFKAKGLIN